MINTPSPSTVDPQTETQTSPAIPDLIVRLPRRIGKIAQLPEDTRDELNARLADGEGGEPLLRWLNQLPETRALLEESFDGHPINKQNLSDWRQGGYAEWRLRQDLLEQTSALTSHAHDLEECSGQFLADSLVKVFTARYAALLARWDGEASEAFDAKLSLFTRMRRDLLSLQKNAHWAAKQTRAWEELEQQDKENFKQEMKDLALAPIKAKNRRDNMSALYGPAGEAIADAINLIEYEDTYPRPADLVAPRNPAPPAPPAVKAKAKPTRSKNHRRASNPQPKSQGTPILAQNVAPEKVNPETPAPESNPVKPLSEPSPSREQGSVGETNL